MKNLCNWAVYLLILGLWCLPLRAGDENAKENETRMIMDDTENYEAKMYWVNEDGK